MSDDEPDEFLARLDEEDRARSSARPAAALACGCLALPGGRHARATVVIVVSGRVKVFSLTEHGEEIVLAVRGPGALLGELSAVDGGPRGASVATLEPVVALVLPVRCSSSSCARTVRRPPCCCG